MATQLQFEIVPHVGIGPVHLGMTPDAVEAAVGALPGALPRFDKGRTNTWCYFDANLQVSFGSSGLVNVIGMSCLPSVLCRYAGRDVFDLPATDLFALIASRERTGQHEYSATWYVFPDQIVTLYEANEQYDRKGGGVRPIFAQVGVGNSEFLDAMNAIEARRAARRAARPGRDNQSTMKPTMKPSRVQV